MLNKNILASISFVAGAAIGSTVTYFIVKKKAQEKINIETSETRQYYMDLERKLKAKEANSECEGGYVYSEPGVYGDVELRDNASMLPDVNIKEHLFVSETKSDKATEPFDANAVSQYNKIVKVYETMEGNDVKINKKTMPYTISPDEFGEFDDYEKIFLTRCSDGYIVDENFEVVDRASLDDIGVEYNMDSFGEYEDDILHIRNEQLKTDFEITQIEDDYKTITHSNEGVKEDLEE